MRSIVALIIASLSAIATAEDHDHHDPHHQGLFFGNPVIGETPSPHSELRFKYILEHDSGGDAHTFEAGLELAFARWGSVEFVVPYVVLDDDGDGGRPSDLDNIGVALKLASFAFEEHGLLVGGGIELDLPTGDDEKGIGSDHVVVVEPFLTAGIRRGPVALIARVAFGVPFNEQSDEKDEVDLAIGYQAALMWQVSERVALVLEIDGESVVSGDAEENLLNISPGIKVRPFETDIEFGAAVSFPLLDDPGFDVRFTFALFLHF